MAVRRVHSYSAHRVGLSVMYASRAALAACQQAARSYAHVRLVAYDPLPVNTSAKVIFYPVFVCLSVCYLTWDLDENFTRDGIPP